MNTYILSNYKNRLVNGATTEQILNCIGDFDELRNAVLNNKRIIATVSEENEFANILNINISANLIDLWIYDNGTVKQIEIQRPENKTLTCQTNIHVINLEVLDRLNSESTTAALSARQGKILNDKFEEYLPLSGGNIEGDITINGDILYNGNEIPGVYYTQIPFTDSEFFIVNFHAEDYTEEELQNFYELLQEMAEELGEVGIIHALLTLFLGTPQEFIEAIHQGKTIINKYTHEGLTYIHKFTYNAYEAEVPEEAVELSGEIIDVIYLSTTMVENMYLTEIPFKHLFAAYRKMNLWVISTIPF